MESSNMINVTTKEDKSTYTLRQHAIKYITKFSKLYAPYFKAWLKYSNKNDIDTGCYTLLREATKDISCIRHPVVSYITKEESAFLPSDAFAMISYEVNKKGIFRECITPRVLEDLIIVLYKNYEYYKHTEITESSRIQLSLTKVAIQNIRNLFINNAILPPATPKLQIYSRHAMIYASQIIDWISNKLLHKDLPITYTDTEIHDIMTFGSHYFGSYFEHNEYDIILKSFVKNEPSDIKLDDLLKMLKYASCLNIELRANNIYLKKQD